MSAEIADAVFWGAMGISGIAIVLTVLTFARVFPDLKHQWDQQWVATVAVGHLVAHAAGPWVLWTNVLLAELPNAGDEVGCIAWGVVLWGCLLILVPAVFGAVWTYIYWLGARRQGETR